MGISSCTGTSDSATAGCGLVVSGVEFSSIEEAVFTNWLIFEPEEFSLCFFDRGSMLGVITAEV